MDERNCFVSVTKVNTMAKDVTDADDNRYATIFMHIQRIRIENIQTLRKRMIITNSHREKVNLQHL